MQLHRISSAGIATIQRLIVCRDEFDLAIANRNHVFVFKRILRHLLAIDVRAIPAAKIRKFESELAIKNQCVMTTHEAVTNTNFAVELCESRGVSDLCNVASSKYR